VRSPVYYRLERGQDSKEMSGYIHLKEFNALAKRDLLTGMLLFVHLLIYS
jgi:carboxyl-terminal processing protease